MAHQGPTFEKKSIWWHLQHTLRHDCNWSTLTIADVDLRGRNILISGANNGIGREAALQFARWGANIVLACRKDTPRHEQQPDAVVKECKAAARLSGYVESEVEWWECDMSDLASVEALATRWTATGKALDILANNAGISPPREFTKTRDGFELLHQINFISHVLLTMSLLPSIAKAKAPRIICTTSCMHFHGIFNVDNANTGIQSYQNNKLFFQVWLTELQRRMLQTPAYQHIAIHGVHPGWVFTGIWSSSKGLSPRNNIEWLINKSLHYLAISPQQGSLTITNAATVAEGALTPKSQTTNEFCGGAKYFNRTWEVEPRPETRSQECRDIVWRFVETELVLSKRTCVSDAVKKDIL